MSMNIKKYVEFDKFFEDKKGAKIPIYRVREIVLSKEDVGKARAYKEKLEGSKKVEYEFAV